MSRRRRAALSGTLLAVAAAVCAPAAARACAVCYGPAESPALHGTRLSIIFLLVLTYLLLGGGVAGFLLLRRRAGRQRASVHTDYATRSSEGLP